MDDVDVNAITERVIEAAHKVSNALGAGFVEKVYENAHKMRKDGLTVVQQHPIKVDYDGIVVGEFCIDMLIENLVLVELKSVSALNDDPMKQARNYLRASNSLACLLINFRTPKVLIRRLPPSPTWKTQTWKYEKQ